MTTYMMECVFVIAFCSIQKKKDTKKFIYKNKMYFPVWYMGGREGGGKGLICIY